MLCYHVILILKLQFRTKIFSEPPMEFSNAEKRVCARLLFQRENKRVLNAFRGAFKRILGEILTPTTSNLNYLLICQKIFD
jgi:hypothetical protein